MASTLRRAVDAVKGLFLTSGTKAANGVSPFSGLGAYFQQFFTQRSAASLASRLRGWVYVCTERRAKALSSLDWTFLRQNEDGETEPLPADHWLNKLVRDPSGIADAALEWITWREIIKAIEHWRCYWGAAVLWTPDGTDDASGPYPLHAWVLPASQVRPINGDKHTVAYFEWNTPKGVKRLARREVCYLPVMAPSDSLFENIAGGYALYDAAVDAISADESTTRFVADFFRNGAMQPMMIEETETPDDPWTQEEFENWARRIAERQKETGNRAPFAKLPRGLTVKVLDLVSNLKGLIGIADKTMEMIAQVWGIPISMLRGNAANFATARVDNYTFRVDTIEPEAYTIEDVLSRHFQKYEPGLLVRHVPAINEDPAELRADELHKLQTGQITVNELRAANGRPLIDDELAGADVPRLGPDFMPMLVKGPLRDATGLAQLTATLASYSSGTITREQGIQIAIDFFGMATATAEAYFPVIEEEEPVEAVPQQEAFGTEQTATDNEEPAEDEESEEDREEEPVVADDADEETTTTSESTDEV